VPLNVAKCPAVCVILALRVHEPFIVVRGALPVPNVVLSLLVIPFTKIGISAKVFIPAMLCAPDVFTMVELSDSAPVVI